MIPSKKDISKYYLLFNRFIFPLDKFQRHVVPSYEWDQKNCSDREYDRTTGPGQSSFMSRASGLVVCGVKRVVNKLFGEEVGRMRGFELYPLLYNLHELVSWALVPKNNPPMLSRVQIRKLIC